MLCVRLAWLNSFKGLNMQKIKQLIISSFEIMKYLVKNIIFILKSIKINIFSLISVNAILSNHNSSYQESNKINNKNVKKVYEQYRAYLLILLLIIFLFLFFTLITFVKIGLFFLFLNMIFIIFIPSYFIFNKSFLSISKLIFLIISYLFTIMIFSLIYFMIQMLSMNDIDNTAFKIINCTTNKDTLDFKDYWSFLYFSIVTITTLGYGDIIPLSLTAKALTSIEVLLGITYVVFGVATLFSNKDNDKEISIEIEKLLKDS